MCTAAAAATTAATAAAIWIEQIRQNEPKLCGMGGVEVAGDGLEQGGGSCMFPFKYFLNVTRRGIKNKLYFFFVK